MSNEPAFPVQDCAAFQYSGMTLRDYFAGQALAQAMRWAFTHPDAPQRADFLPEEWAAKIAYAHADALLIERERGQ